MKENIIEEAQVDNSELIIGGTSLLLLVSVFVIGGTLATGIITGLTTSIGLGFVLFKLRTFKPQYWNYMMDHPLATDVIVSAGFIFLLAPATATGLIAGASGAVFASAGITMANSFVGRVHGVEPLKLKDMLKKLTKRKVTDEHSTELAHV